MAILEHLPLTSPPKREDLLDFPNEVDELAISVEQQQMPACEVASNELSRTLNIANQYRNEVTTSRQDDIVNEIIAQDAIAFIATILPKDALEAFSIESSQESEIEPPTPSLADAYLLAKAYDATKDDTIKLSLEYILYADEPPALSDFLKEAYKASIKNNTSLMSEYLAIDARRSGREDTGNLTHVTK